MRNNQITIRPLENKLADFPVETVKKTATDFNKAFHAKIFTLFAASESELHAFPQALSPHYHYCFCFMEHDEGQWFLDWEGVGTVRRWILDTIEREGSAPIFQIHREWQKSWAHYELVRARIDRTKLQSLSDEGFYRLFEEFHAAYLCAGGVAYMADTFMSTGETDWFVERISCELVSKGVPEKEVIEAVAVLTNPLHQSYTLLAEWKLAELGAAFERMYPKELPSLAELRKERGELYLLMEEYTRAFFWIRNNYWNVEVLDVLYFYKELEAKAAVLKRLGSSFTSIVRKYAEEIKAARARCDGLVVKCKLSESTSELLKVAWLFGQWKDMRKGGSYVGMHYYDLFLQDLARRTGYSKSDLTYLISQEVRGLLFEKRNVSKLVAARRRKTFFAVTPEGYFIAEGRATESYFSCVSDVKSGKESVGQLKGVSACRGKASGIVRVIHKTEDMRLFQKGEILVTNQTTPEFVPIMKKAAAIVAEQGGITSHAAVISRELNVPCVISIKTATSILKDGDEVEVNADSGIVKILKKA